MIYFVIFMVVNISIRIFPSILASKTFPSELHPALITIRYLTLSFTAPPEEVSRRIFFRLNCIAYYTTGTSKRKDLKALTKAWKILKESLGEKMNEK